MKMRKVSNAMLSLALFLTLPALLFAQADMLITNATILTGTGEKIENGSIYIKDGKIQAIGTNVRAPQGIPTVDASGHYVMPGIIDHHSHIAGEALNEVTSQNTSMTDVTEVVVHDPIAVYRGLTGGVTTIHQLHGSANVIGGRDNVAKLKWGRPAEEMTVQDAMEGVKFALGENPTRTGRAPGGNQARFPNTRMGVEYTLRDYFTQAQEYKRAWEEYELKKDGKIKPANNYEKKFGPVAPRKDNRLEAMAGVLDGTIRVHSHGYSNHELAMLMRITQEFGFAPASIEHGHEAYMLADEIAEAGTIVSMFVDFWNYKIEASMGTAFAPALLTEKGVKVAINSDDVFQANSMRYLNLHAAKTIRYSTDLTEEDAIKMVTANPAHGLRIGERIGTLEVGKDGDLAIFDGNPFSIYSKCIKTIIEGEIYFDRDKAVKTEDWIKGKIKDRKITSEDS